MSEATELGPSSRVLKIQGQMQWLNWKIDELQRHIEDAEETVSLGGVPDASVNLLKQERQMLQQIGQSLEQSLNLAHIIKNLIR